MPYLCDRPIYMSKPATRSYSRYAREAAELFGYLIHNARVEKGLTIAAVAERAGISRGLVHRIEQGDMGCSLGAVFEVARPYVSASSRCKMSSEHSHQDGS